MCRPVDDGVKMNDMSDDQGNDDQDTAEGFDEEMVGTDRILSEDAVTDFPPERPRGLPFADADEAAGAGVWPNVLIESLIVKCFLMLSTSSSSEGNEFCVCSSR